MKKTVRKYEATERAEKVEQERDHEHSYKIKYLSELTIAKVQVGKQAAQIAELQTTIRQLRQEDLRPLVLKLRNYISSTPLSNVEGINLVLEADATLQRLFLLSRGAKSEPEGEK